MIETVRIMIDFNEQKYEALAKKLSKNSRIGSVEKSVERYLEYLYETAVPAGQRKEIEKEIKSAIRLEKASGEPEIKFSVITLRTEGGNISFKSEKLLIFLDLIKCYRDKVRDWENITDLETLKSLFGKSHVVKAESLPLLVNRFCNNPSVTMIADGAVAERSQGEVVRRSRSEHGRTEHGVGHVHSVVKTERLLGFRAGTDSLLRYRARRGAVLQRKIRFLRSHAGGKPKHLLHGLADYPTALP